MLLANEWPASNLALLPSSPAMMCCCSRVTRRGPRHAPRENVSEDAWAKMRDSEFGRFELRRIDRSLQQAEFAGSFADISCNCGVPVVEVGKCSARTLLTS